MRGDPQPHSHQGDGLNWTQGPAKGAQPGSRRSLGLRAKASSSFQQQDGLSLSSTFTRPASRVSIRKTRASWRPLSEVLGS